MLRYMSPLSPGAVPRVLLLGNGIHRAFSAGSWNDLLRDIGGSRFSEKEWKELEDASTLYLFEGTQSVMPVDAEVVETVEEVAETVSDEAAEVVDEVVEAVSDEAQGYIAIRAYTDDEGNQVAEFMDFFAIENVEEAVEAIAE